MFDLNFAIKANTSSIHHQIIFIVTVALIPNTKKLSRKKITRKKKYQDKTKLTFRAKVFDLKRTCKKGLKNVW